ncbi:hypothetical protein LWC34_08725 [Kibdelosporangium philippinense]|uniref:Uncharacterized protein n=1 Tax=Kibdelosporangium philippinense TaxID=211113 RepID=A0ABS8Z504_9PSEU|nr:hypothetical protein [Kibdelosporangium philippinense]MCE7002915.1 hypothetical protein [Kibdelosporangium philippinense]
MAAKSPKWAKTLKNGAIIGPYDMMNPGHRLLGFADGASGRAVQAAAEIVTATRDEIEEDDAFARHVLYPVREKKNMYDDIGTAGA